MTAEIVRQVLVTAGQDIDTERAIGLEDVVGAGIALDADQHGRWHVGHAADRRGRQSMAARRAVGRDDVHGSAEPAHGLAKALLNGGVWHNGHRSSTSSGVFEREQQSSI